MRVRTVIAPLAGELEAQLAALDLRLAGIARRFMRRLALEPQLDHRLTRVRDGCLSVFQAHPPREEGEAEELGFGEPQDDPHHVTGRYAYVASYLQRPACDRRRSRGIPPPANSGPPYRRWSRTSTEPRSHGNLVATHCGAHVARREDAARVLAPRGWLDERRSALEPLSTRGLTTTQRL
jgi:hypothetical protein